MMDVFLVQKRIGVFGNTYGSGKIMKWVNCGEFDTIDKAMNKYFEILNKTQYEDLKIRILKVVY